MPPDDRRTRTREEFVDAAFRVIDARGPDARMGDIAAEAGSTKPRLYRHFTDKDDLFRAIAERIGTDLYHVVRPDVDFVLHSPLDALQHAISAYAGVIAQHPNVFVFLAHNRFASDESSSRWPSDIGRDVSRKLSRMVAGALDAIQADSTGSDLATRAAVAAVVATTEMWLSPDTDAAPLSQQEFVDQTCVVVRGIIEAFLLSRGVDVDPNEPMYMVLARRAAHDDPPPDGQR